MRDSGSKRSPGERFEPLRSLERLIAECAGAQHGVIALWQLLELGLSAPAVRHRVTAGRLHRIHAGVFAVGHKRLTREGHYMAAVLACGRDAALSHRSAADLRGLRRSAGRPRIDVISPRRPGRRRAGIDSHTSSTLAACGIEIVDAIPCTSVARTLLDLAVALPRRAIERAVDQAEVLRVLDARQIDEVLARAGNHRGAAVLQAVLGEHAPGTTLTRNDLEEAFLAICHDSGLPRPEVNAWIALDPTGYEADFLWRAAGLIAETDGRDVHATKRAFEHDRRRDQRLMRAGYRVVRFTRRQVLEEPRDVLATLRALVA
jgi:predicted transcriptional regulator of viral defense system